MRTLSDTFENRAAALRRRMAARIAARGGVRSPEWRAALEAVPRHEFVPAFWVTDDWENPAGPGWRLVSRDRDEAAWLEAAYSDESLVTQFNEHLIPATADDATIDALRGQLSPTSSSTMPSMVLRMWEELETAPSSSVLEIGTGTGYSTALGCAVLGDDHVTSVEVDPVVAAQARSALERSGYHPTLVVGDGLAGHPANAPYDRLIATCSVRRVPRAWIEQVRPGGTLLVTIDGHLGAQGRARLRVTARGIAEGSFLCDESFMLARAQVDRSMVSIPYLDDTPERVTEVGPWIFDDPMASFIAQLVAPSAHHIPFDHAGSVIHYLGSSRGSWSAVRTRPDGIAIVRQGGRRNIWDVIEEAIGSWRDHGSPGIEHFRLRVGKSRQTIWLDVPQAHVTGSVRIFSAA